MSIDFTYKLVGLLIVVAGWIWGASKLSSNLKSLKVEFDAYKKLVEKQISDNQKDTENLGKDVHRYNKNTQQVINDMRQKEIIPAVLNIEALSKSDEATKKDISEINKTFTEFLGLVNDIKTQIALLTQSRNK